MAIKLWSKPLKWLLRVLLTAAALIAILLTVTVWILTPGRLTPLVNRYGSNLIDHGRIDTRKVELTFWSTFPNLEVQVDSLTVISTALDSCVTDGIPAAADTLISVERIRGAIDIRKLLTLGEFELRDVELLRPTVNLVQATPGLANYDIMDPSEETSDAPTTIPVISINRFWIEGEAPVTYISLPDSINAGITINRIGLTDRGAPVYAVEADADIKAKLGTLDLLSGEKLTLDGRLIWNPATPGRIILDKFAAGIGDINTVISMDAEYTDSLRISSMQVELKPLPVESIMRYLPDGTASGADDLRTDMTIAADVVLTHPYTVGDTSALIPDIDVNITVPRSYVEFERLRLRDVELRAKASVTGRDLNATTVTIDKMAVHGMGGRLEASARLSSPLSDPLVSGHIKGSVDLGRLPHFVTSHLHGEILGALTADTDFKFRQSHLSAKNFHKANISGTASLSDFRVRMPADSMTAYADKVDLKFGTSNGFVRDSIRIDSLLTASVSVDSASLDIPALELRISKAKLGFGCKNTTTSSDTSAINPIGATLSIGALRYFSHTDSTRAMLRNLKGGAALRRYADEARVPQLTFGVKAGRAMYGDATTRLILREGQFGVTAHLRKRRSGSGNRNSSRRDSMRLVRQQRLDSLKKSETEILDMSVDNSTAAILRRWDIRGSVKAKSARAFTPYFPLRNRLNDIDLKFTTDSVILTDATLRSGHSDFRISGLIANLRRTLIGNARQPLRMKLSVKSDTIDINQLVGAAMRGAAYAQKSDSTAMSFTDDDARLEAQLDSVASDSTAAILIPVNIDAEFNMHSANIIYSDIILHDFIGSLLIYRGALNLRNLSASTDIGSASLNALYYAPAPRDISFGLGLKLDRFQIDKVAEILPAVDSLMPLMRDFGGVVDADLAATASVDSMMNIDLPSLKAALKLTGDSLVVLDPDTYKTVAKWLMFKNKNHNMIDHMEVELVIENSMMEMYPFMFDFDRYRLGVMGNNDLAMNLNYHVSVLKSPIPFKFGINIGGTADDMKIRLGRAKFKENMAGQRIAIADTTRINLVNEFEKLFRRGVSGARVRDINIRRPKAEPDSYTNDAAGADTISAQDSLYLINEGLIQR